MNIKRLGAVLAAAVISVSVVTVTALAAGTRVPINEKYFPDENFREYISENLDTDGNGYLSQKERDEVTRIDIFAMEIASLKGIGYFENLEILNCQVNELVSLDMSKNKMLRELYCNENELTSLDVSKNKALKKLLC